MTRFNRLVLAVAAMALLPPVVASAQISFVGEWSGRYHEDQPDRVPGEEPGDFSGLPINDAARAFGDAWDVGRHSVLEHQCAPYTLPYMFFGPNQFRIFEEHNPDTQELIALRMYMGTYQQRRTIWLDGRAHPPAYAPHTFMGFSTGEWHGDTLTITTTHIKQGYFRRGGMPASDRTTVVEHWIRHGDVLSQVTIATDPVYLTEPYIRSQEFVTMPRGNTNWLYNCEYAMELPRDKNLVPHYLPGQNPWLGEFEALHAMPTGGVRGGAETTRPEWEPGDSPLPADPRRNGGFRPEMQPRPVRTGEIETVHVQGNVHLIAGAGANIVVQVGEDGILVVDTGNGRMTDDVIEAIAALAPDKEIRWIVNTGMRPDHTSGNGAVSQAGRTVNGNPAAIVAHENVGIRMIEADVPDAERPYNTYFEDRRDFPFNGEPIVVYHEVAGDDTASVVMFRRSDVIAAGDVFSTESYPVIDLERGGSVASAIGALNRLLDLAVPSKMLQEAGTYVIPGHGRIGDEHDVVMYRDMLQIVSDRVRDMVERGMTLAQVRAARPTMDYDPRYGSDAGDWTTAMFVEAMYREFKGPEGASSGAAP